MTARPLIHLVEDDASVRDSLVALLEVWGYGVKAYPDGESFLADGSGHGAACILLDVRLPGIDGLSLLARIRAAGQTTPVVVITGHGDVAMAVRALQCGAQDFIEKPFDDADLVGRIEAVKPATGINETGPGTTGGAATGDAAAIREAASAREQLSTLTRRETEVMREIVAGYPNKLIAHRLGISPKTVELHRARVMNKTGSKSLSHLVRLALKAGVDPEGEGE